MEGDVELKFPHTESNRSLEYENSWSAICEDVKKQLTEQLSPIKDEPYFGEEVEEKLTNEHDFYVKLLELVDILKTKEKSFLLFDIDETIARLKWDEDQGEYCFIRPTFTYILQQLQPLIQEGKVRVGFLTSRGLEKVKEQLDDNAHLASIKSFIDPELVFSCRDRRIYGDYHELSFYDDYSIVDQQSLLSRMKDNPSFLWSINPGDVVKIQVLQELKDKSPNTTLAIVDDFAYPDFLNTQQDVFGVSLRNKGVYRI